jgi:predicted RND superfamily exporter protein
MSTTAGIERPNRAVIVLERIVFGNRRLVLGLFAAVTLLMAWVAATGLHIDAGFTKLLPLRHEYMQTYVEHREQFGGANNILIALVARDGDIFTPQFFEALRLATDEVFFLPGVDRARVRSLFTPNVRFTEVIEDGISADNVVPADFTPDEEGLAQVRRNILKAGIVGRLVANDFSAAMISAQLQEINPDTGKPIDYAEVSRHLEERLRARFETPDSGIDVRIIGFAKVIGDITEGAGRVLMFFLFTFFVTALLVWLYTQHWRLTIVPLACSLAAVVWQLGILTLLGYGIDPMGILVPFLVFAIGVSHSVQIVSAVRAEIFDGHDADAAARASFRRLLVPGTVALAADVVGFITILFIHIQVIQEMAITASLGVGVVIITNLIIIPLLLSRVRYDQAYRERLARRARALAPIWQGLSVVAQRGPALAMIVLGVALLAWGSWQGAGVRIGDLHRGVPELRPDSRYNVDSETIASRFSIGVDIITVIVETVPDACIDPAVLTEIDAFTWHMRNDPGVQDALSLPTYAKVINAGWNEGSLKWRVISRDPKVLVQSTSPIDTSMGLRNADCSVMPVMLFTKDHKAETIARIVRSVKDYAAERNGEKQQFRLATGNVGVMAATNEEVSRAQFPILAGVFGAIVVMCVLTYASLRASIAFLLPMAALAALAWLVPTLREPPLPQWLWGGAGLYALIWAAIFPSGRPVLCIVLPLWMVSELAYALMAWLEIGLKVNTLPVVALGAGIGVDYGIYIYSRFKSILAEGHGVHEAWLRTLRITGAGVVFTGLTLAIGVVAWIFSPLKFQADMGILLTFLFLVNMLGAILLLPALAAWLVPARLRGGGA